MDSEFMIRKKSRCQTVAKIYQNRSFEVVVLSNRDLVRGCVFVKVFGRLVDFSRTKNWSMEGLLLPFAMRRSGVRAPRSTN